MKQQTEYTPITERVQSSEENLLPGSLHYVNRAGRKNRLALILSEPFDGRTEKSVYVIFITSHLNPKTFSECFIPIFSTGRENTVALCNSLSPVDLSAFRHYHGNISPEDLAAVKQKLQQILLL